MPLFPMFMKLQQRRCVVVGAGKIAASKAAGLLAAGAQVVVIGPEADDWIQTRARAGKLEWQPHAFGPKDVAGAFLAVAATDSVEVNQAVARACARQKVLCNAVDDPARCDFFYPAVVRRGALQIAISTGGSSPAVARRLRAELQRQFGPDYKPWLEDVARQRRQILARDLSQAKRRRLLDEIASREAFEQFVRERTSASARGKE